MSRNQLLRSSLFGEMNRNTQFLNHLFGAHLGINFLQNGLASSSYHKIVCSDDCSCDKLIPCRTFVDFSVIGQSSVPIGNGEKISYHLLRAFTF